MRYLSFPDREAARARSAREAEGRGCGPVTVRWWASEEDAATGAAVLVIPDDETAALSADEQARLTAEPDWLAARREAAAAFAAPSRERAARS